MRIFQTAFLFSLGFVCALGSFAQSNSDVILPKVDKRVELISIAARLAEINGFKDDLNPAYGQQIEAHFASFKTHPFIQLLQELKPKLDEAGWEIPAVAFHLSQPPKLEPLMDFADTANADGWESRELFNARFVGLLQQFYRDTKADEFFASQEAYYNLVNQEYETQGVLIHKKWLADFFGLQTTEEYFPVIALGIRSGGYMRVNFASNHRHTFTIYETAAFDERGIPTTFTQEVYPRMMLHEYVHAFVNQLIDQNEERLRPSAEIILKNPKVFALVENTFYGNWQYLLYESLVRASSIQYFKANKGVGQDIEKEIAKQEAAGFLWMRGLLKELDEYAANRDQYQNLEQFMPRLIQFFDKTAQELKTN